MWDGKQKAVTFSYDDGVCQDRRLVDMFNYYHVKATFNLNSGMQTYASHYDFGNVRVHHMNAEGLKTLYIMKFTWINKIWNGCLTARLPVWRILMEHIMMKWFRY